MKIQANGLHFDTGFTGVLGPQGVGKTRLLKQLAALDLSLVESAPQARTNTCYVAQELEAFSRLTVKEYLCVMAGRKGFSNERLVGEVERSVEQARIARYTEQKIGSLSNLTKSRTLLAKALLNDPELLLLDEVLVGLTEQERLMIGYTLSEIAKDRVLVQAGGLGESVEGLYDSVCLLHPEKGAVQVAANEAYSWVEGKVWEYVTPELPSLEGRIVTSCKRSEDGYYIREVALDHPSEEVSQVTPTLADAYMWWATHEVKASRNGKKLLG